MRLQKYTYQFIRRLSAVLSMLLFTWVTVSMPYILIKQAEHKQILYSINKDNTHSASDINDEYSDINEERSGLNEERMEEDTPLSEYLCEGKDAVFIIPDPVQLIMGEDTFYLDNHSLELITPPPEGHLTLA
ncbi:hypothetical protein [Chitinophaga nivalis]|uniref:Uncharacterized protein n=1 Tax=Chitinophaga nivalis TaxID=2991709 RepID=A0ABT3IN45_9BACT|nr:hypothetical protein [Chitinophaga nivalis]MCW3464933.1 hypothetical protein [Chitinophaga nivalis]MCW3485375.1 hypothetical protein [Chitinophaga nivalis]